MFHTRIILALVPMLVLASAAGCSKKRSGDDSAPAPDGPTVRVVVDEPGIRYLYRTGSGANRSTLSLNRIPPGYRSAVAVQGGSLPEADASGEEFFVVNLSEAKSGDEVHARLVKRERLVESSAAGVAAASLALDVVDFATYTTESSFGPRADGRTISFIVEEGGKRSVKRMFMKHDPEPSGSSFTGPFAEDSASSSKGPGQRTPWDRVFGDHGKDESSARTKGVSGWKEVVVYSTSWCGACKQARAWLEQNDVPHTTLDVERDEGARERMLGDAKRLGTRANSVPMFVIGTGSSARTMSGWNPSQFVSLAKAE